MLIDNYWGENGCKRRERGVKVTTTFVALLYKPPFQPLTSSKGWVNFLGIGINTICQVEFEKYQGKK